MKKYLTYIGTYYFSAGLINENLYQLMNLKNLSQLHLGNKNCQSFNFYEGVAPVLEGIGLHLTKLVLEEFTEIDVDYIGSKCPQLQHLAFSGILTYAPTGKYRDSLNKSRSYYPNEL